ncbi:cytochrome c biogenesis protein ResB [Aquisalimonas asiatica]|uniref:Cytochrome c biogenesis protein n=1 Tax=Aquisalimonas asiatica TaxID=406100 RepID=A0A1H8UR40_9GAMM|nr:cytochrome c biogenesis protein ResB [Aquisalimonas asiatica]SEP05048.1 cytochrome c biogenesis protein [Aquisalimonas asiatica]
MSAASPAARTVPREKRVKTQRLLVFLGSMNLAITLLVAVAIASVIGSVLQQDQAWNTYLQKFGPFWFELYRVLGLYDVYSAPWFIAMLLFLVLSTSVCIYRHGPVVWKEATRFRERQRDGALRAHRHRREWHTEESLDAALARARHGLQAQGYRVRAHEDASRVVLAGMRGRGNRLGYLFSHLAIVVICVGGLMDANMGLKFQQWAGQLRIETRDDLPLSELDPESRLSPGSTAFRGTISLPEGDAGRAVYIDVRDGYLAQELPFIIEVVEFRIDYYANGEPRSYESDLLIHDPDLDAPLERTVAVNDPVHHRGHAIYQSSYSDGGTMMDLRFWPMHSTAAAPVDGRVAVHGELPITLGERTYTLEMEDFSRRTTRPDDHAAGEGTDFGPSFTYRLRGPTGEARQYRNFMRPQRVDDGMYFLTGMREAPGQDYQYLYIPADADDSLDRFMAFQDALKDDTRLRASAESGVAGMLRGAEGSQAGLAPYLAGVAQSLVGELLQGGVPAVEARIDALVRQGGLEDDAGEVVRGLMRDAFHAALLQAYADVLEREYERTVSPAEMGEADRRFFSDAMDVLMVLPGYGAPLLPELRDFDHRQATGLQITRAPGEGVVYAGSLMLVIGLGLMFYVRHRRVWLRLQQGSDGRVGWLLAGWEQRRSSLFGAEFQALADRLERDPGRGQE